MDDDEDNQARMLAQLEAINRQLREKLGSRVVDAVPPLSWNTYVRTHASYCGSCECGAYRGYAALQFRHRPDCSLDGDVTGPCPECGPLAEGGSDGRS